MSENSLYRRFLAGRPTEGLRQTIGILQNHALRSAIGFIGLVVLCAGCDSPSTVLSPDGAGSPIVAQSVAPTQAAIASVGATATTLRLDDGTIAQLASPLSYRDRTYAEREARATGLAANADVQKLFREAEVALGCTNGRARFDFARNGSLTSAGVHITDGGQRTTIRTSLLIAPVRADGCRTPRGPVSIALTVARTSAFPDLPVVSLQWRADPTRTDLFAEEMFVTPEGRVVRRAAAKRGEALIRSGLIVLERSRPGQAGAFERLVRGTQNQPVSRLLDMAFDSRYSGAFGLQSEALYLASAGIVGPALLRRDHSAGVLQAASAAAARNPVTYGRAGGFIARTATASPAPSSNGTGVNTPAGTGPFDEFTAMLESFNKFLAELAKIFDSLKKVGDSFCELVKFCD